MLRHIRFLPGTANRPDGLLIRRSLVRVQQGEPKKLFEIFSKSFLVIFALRRVILLRSDIRLTPSDIRFASLKGEYNITFANAKISLCRKA